MTLIERVLEDTALQAVAHPRLLSLSRSVFSALAGLVTTGRVLPVASAACCTGPYGTGSCFSGDCDPDGQCGGNYLRCVAVVGFCYTPGSNCWSSNSCRGVTCCDCSCDTGQTQWYCYCHN